LIYYFQEGKGIYVHGQIVSEGTKDKPVNFKPENPNISWGSVYFDRAKEACSFNYTNFYEGVVHSKHTDLTITNSELKIINKSLGEGENRICILWIHHGKLTYKNNIMQGKSCVGEGINVNFAKSIVENSIFYDVADAIEFIDVNDGIINGNKVVNSTDDAIDLNGCNNVKITNNILINSKDKGISIGTEQYGASRGIFVENNLIIGNKIAISVKDSSTAIINNNTLYDNSVGIELYKKRDGYIVGGSATVNNCIIAKCKKRKCLG
jgi:parallel beta-helix repeat protein